MEIDRRTVAAGLCGLAFGGFRPATLRAHDTVEVVATAKTGNGEYALIGLDERGRVRFHSPLPARGHGIVRRPGHTECVLVERRPGRDAFVFDCRNGGIGHRIICPDDRRFQGHAAFSDGGGRLFSSESDFEGERGVIGVWDASSGYARLGEFESHGIGPHDIIHLPATNVLAVANGGILTHPDSGRAKLNLADMEPSIVIIDARHGHLVHSARLDPAFHQLSIRHLAPRRDRAIMFALQDEGPVGRARPLIGRLATSGSMTLFDTPEADLRALRGYCADIAVSGNGRITAATFPRGNRIGFWATDDGTFLGARPVVDCAAIGASKAHGGFIYASGRGEILHATVKSSPPRVDILARHSAWFWDNHLAVL